MREVTKVEFLNAVGPRNVHPRVEEGSLKGRIHVSHWEMQTGNREILGRTEADSWGVDPTRFFLS